MAHFKVTGLFLCIGRIYVCIIGGFVDFILFRIENFPELFSQVMSYQRYTCCFICKYWIFSTFPFIRISPWA
jgi:hypothetical protein